MSICRYYQDIMYVEQKMGWSQTAFMLNLGQFSLLHPSFDMASIHVGPDPLPPLFTNKKAVWSNPMWEILCLCCQFVYILCVSYEYAPSSVSIHMLHWITYITKSRTKCLFSGYVPFKAITGGFISECILHNRKCVAYIWVDTSQPEYTVWAFEPLMWIIRILLLESIKSACMLCICYSKQPT